MWFLNQFQEMVNVESELVNQGGTLSKELLLKAKRTGFSDAWIATLQGVFQKEVREFRF